MQLIIYLFFYKGFLIFASYCFNAKVAGKWAGLIGRAIPFFKRYENLDSSATSTTSVSSGSSSRNLRGSNITTTGSARGSASSVSSARSSSSSVNAGVSGSSSVDRTDSSV